MRHTASGHAIEETPAVANDTTINPISALDLHESATVFLTTEVFKIQSPSQIHMHAMKSDVPDNQE